MFSSLFSTNITCNYFLKTYEDVSTTVGDKQSSMKADYRKFNNEQQMTENFNYISFVTVHMTRDCLGCKSGAL